MVEHSGTGCTKNFLRWFNFLHYPKMPRGVTTPEDLVARVVSLKHQGLSQRRVSEMLTIPKTTVQNILANVSSHKSPARRGIKRKVSCRDERALSRSLLSDKSTNLRKLKNELETSGTHMGLSTVFRAVKRHCSVTYDRRKKMRVIGDKQRRQRMTWAKSKLKNIPNWDNVIFADEKRWCLDGPDGLRGEWRHKLGKLPPRFRRQGGGGSIMVWAGFSARGKTRLVLLTQTMNSVVYTRVLDDNCIPCARDTMQPNWYLLHDNSSVHRSKSTQQYLDDQGIQVMMLPSYSPDLNPMENLWAILTKDVFAGGRQFTSKDSLLEAILTSWNQIKAETLQNLATSMTKHCDAVVKAKGNAIKY